MIKKIQELEKISRLLEPSHSARRDLREAVAKESDKFLDNIEDNKAYFWTEEMGKGISEEGIEEGPEAIDTILEGISEHVIYTGLNGASGGHLAYIPGGGVYPGSLGDYLAATVNPYSGVAFTSPGGVRLENILIRWMCDLVGYPKTSGGNLTSGGSLANLMGIVCGRDHNNIKAADYHRCVIYLSKQVHHSVDKAIRISGLGESIKRYINLDDHFRMDTADLCLKIEKDKKDGLLPLIVVASAGTTDTGAVDPLDEIGKIASQSKLWYHVDAAYGGFFLLSEEVKDKLKGIEMADSIVMDPHKGLFNPYGLGAVLVKSEEILYKSHYYMANYMQDTTRREEDLSPADLSPELTRHFRGLRLWIPLKLFGLKPFRAALDEKILLCRYFYKEIQKIDGMEVGPSPDLSVCFFRYLPKKGSPDVFNEKLIDTIQKDGRVFLSSTMLNGKFYIRLAVLSFRSHLDRVKLGLEIIKGKIAELEG